MTHPYINILAKLFTACRNNELAIPMKRYMKNKFDFLGIKSPERKEIYKNQFRNNGLPDYLEIKPIIKSCWNQPYREFQYFGIELLDRMKKQFTPEIVDLLEEIIITKSWWDTVDLTAGRLVGYLFKSYPELIPETTEKWMNTQNIWLQRTCILFQLKYKSKTDFELLSSFINRLSSSNEFFIQKAIGWALREYGKTNPTTVTNFTKNNKLAKLSYTEAMRIIVKSNLKAGKN